MNGILLFLLGVVVGYLCNQFFGTWLKKVTGKL
jgi:hypothetical protein